LVGVAVAEHRAGGLEGAGAAPGAVQRLGQGAGGAGRAQPGLQVLDGGGHLAGHLRGGDEPGRVRRRRPGGLQRRADGGELLVFRQLQLGELGAQPLHQQDVAPGVGPEQGRIAPARGGLEDAQLLARGILAGDHQLQHGRPSVGRHRVGDKGLAALADRRAERQVPRQRHLAHQVGQAVQPGAPLGGELGQPADLLGNLDIRCGHPVSGTRKGHRRRRRRPWLLHSAAAVV